MYYIYTISYLFINYKRLGTYIVVDVMKVRRRFETEKKPRYHIATSRYTYNKTYTSITIIIIIYKCRTYILYYNGLGNWKILYPSTTRQFDYILWPVKHTHRPFYTHTHVLKYIRRLRLYGI